MMSSRIFLLLPLLLQTTTPTVPKQILLDSQHPCIPEPINDPDSDSNNHTKDLAEEYPIFLYRFIMEGQWISSLSSPRPQFNFFNSTKGNTQSDFSIDQYDHRYFGIRLIDGVTVILKF